MPRSIKSAAAPGQRDRQRDRQVCAQGAFVAQLQRRGLRRQAHAFADDIVFAITGKKGIGRQNRVQGAAARRQRRDLRFAISTATIRRPSRGRRDCGRAGVGAGPAGALLHPTSGQPGHFLHNLSTGQRRVIARYSGLNTSAAVSPDGSKVAMILSKAAARTSGCLQRRRHGFETVDDGRRIRRRAGRRTDNGFVSRRKSPSAGVLAKVPAGGGEIQRIPHRRRAESDRAGLVAGRQMDRVHLADGRV
jgi:hypothetical protein